MGEGRERRTAGKGVRGIKTRKRKKGK